MGSEERGPLGVATPSKSRTLVSVMVFIFHVKGENQSYYKEINGKSSQQGGAQQYNREPEKGRKLNPEGEREGREKSREGARGHHNIQSVLIY